MWQSVQEMMTDLKEEMFIHWRDLRKEEGQSLWVKEGNPGTLGALEVWERGETLCRKSKGEPQEDSILKAYSTQ